MPGSTTSFIMRHISMLLHLDFGDILKLGNEIPIPKFDETLMISFLESAIQQFTCNTPVVRIYNPAIIIGDLHGNLNDFLRIFSSIPDPFSKTFVFLGDYVDRGQFQTEVATMLLALAVEYPLNFILLRGNHEFASVNSKGGFYNEVTSSYSEKVFDLFNEAFNYLPLLAIIKDQVLCLHGGIGPNFKYITQIQDMKMPIKSFDDNKVMQEILWSDPVYDQPGFDMSPRGMGYLYGGIVLKQFLDSNKLKTLVRGHESITCGVQCDEGRMLFTVFSSSGYQDNLCKGGYLTIDEKCTPNACIYKAIPKILRSDANFSEMKMIKEKSNSIKSVNSFKSLSNILLATPQNHTRRRRLTHASALGNENLPLKNDRSSSMEKIQSMPMHNQMNSPLYFGTI